MDMQMPVMDGIQATIEIRKNPCYAKLPVVAMTANAMQADRERCIDVGMNDFVSKPIDPQDLWRALARWTQPRDGLGQPPTLASKLSPWPATGTAEDDMLQQIAGLDTRLGLRQVMGKQALYLSLLRRFVSTNQAGLRPIEQALQAGDTATAERLAHTLKGLSGNIGASALQIEMEKVEAALRGQASLETVRPLLAPPATLLADLLAQLQARLPAQASADSSGVGDPEEIAPVCRKMRELLAFDDPEAAVLLQDHATLLRAALGDNYRALKIAVDEFDFEAALQVLTVAATQANITL